MIINNSHNDINYEEQYQNVFKYPFPTLILVAPPLPNYNRNGKSIIMLSVVINEKNQIQNNYQPSPQSQSTFSFTLRKYWVKRVPLGFYLSLGNPLETLLILVSIAYIPMQQ